MLFAIGFCVGVLVTLLVLVAASYLWPVESATAAHRDPRAPAGMNRTEYDGWKTRRDIADAYIAQSEARRAANLSQ